MKTLLQAYLLTPPLNPQKPLVESIGKCKRPVTPNKSNDYVGPLDAYNPATAERLAADDIPSTKGVNLRL